MILSEASDPDSEVLVNIFQTNRLQTIMGDRRKSRDF